MKNGRTLIVIFSLFTFHFSTFTVSAQDSLYTRQVINSLTAKYCGGRGYVFDGDKRAAFYINSLFSQYGLQKFDSTYFQNLSFPVNTFPGDMKVRFGKKKLKPGVDYIVNPASKGVKGLFEVYKLKDLVNFNSDSIKNKVVVIDKVQFKDNEAQQLGLKKWMQQSYGAAGVIFIEEKKLTWSVATSIMDYFSLHILKASFPENEKTCYLNIEQHFVEQHKTQNIIGFVKGEVADTFIVFTAHYDHLGWMGSKTYFPGANDNASGTSMLINLAKQYAEQKQKPKYSIAFIAFAGEEGGLIGSEFYTEHPLFPLSKIKFLLNMDLLGTGDDGLMVVNATEFETQYNTLAKINSEKNLLPKIDKRGKARNSDHYWFTEKGVPAFFIYTLGGIAAYHDVFDKAETLPLTKYKEVFQLITDFEKSF